VAVAVDDDESVDEARTLLEKEGAQDVHVLDPAGVKNAS